MWPAASGLKSENCWCEPDSNYFRVRGLNYLRDRKKVSAGDPFADLIATDWLVDYQRIDDVCSRPTGTCQRKILNGGASHLGPDPFVFAVNIQVPGSRHYSIVYYYVLKEPLDKVRVGLEMHAVYILTVIRLLSSSSCFFSSSLASVSTFSSTRCYFFHR